MTHDLHSLHAAWVDAKKECNTLDMDSPEYDPAFAGLLKLEEDIMAAPTINAIDLALKIIVADDEGDMCMNTSQRALVRAAYEIAGLPLYPAWRPTI